MLSFPYHTVLPSLLCSSGTGFGGFGGFGSTAPTSGPIGTRNAPPFKEAIVRYPLRGFLFSFFVFPFIRALISVDCLFQLCFLFVRIPLRLWHWPRLAVSFAFFHLETLFFSLTLTLSPCYSLPA